MSRAHELQEAFLRGMLPEQEGRAPATQWCAACKGDGETVELDERTPKREKCKVCGGRGVVRA